MPTFHGNDGEFHVGANAVLEVLSFTHTNSAEWVDDSCAGDTVRTRKPGKDDGNGTLAVNYDPGDTTGQMALKAGLAVTVTLFPAGPAAGSQLTGTIYVSDVQIDQEQDSINKRTVTYTGYLEESVI